MLCSEIVLYFSSNFHLPLCLSVYVCFVSVGKSRQWDPWLQRPSCNSKSQSHLWHWAPWSNYLWAPVHHLLGWQRRETRECGRGKHTDRMHPACAPNACTYGCVSSFSFTPNEIKRVYWVRLHLLSSNRDSSNDPRCSLQLHSARRERSPLPDDKVRSCIHWEWLMTFNCKPGLLKASYRWIGLRLREFCVLLKFKLVCFVLVFCKYDTNSSWQ